MKKILLLLALLPLFFSCTLNDFGDDIQVVNTTVSVRDWRAYTDANHLNLYYSCTLSMPEITRNVFENGVVGVNLVTMNSFSNATQYFQQPLPYVHHLENAQGARWTRTIDYDYSQGQLTIYVTNSDFLNDAPPAMDFRITIQH